MFGVRDHPDSSHDCSKSQKKKKVQDAVTSFSESAVKNSLRLTFSSGVRDSNGATEAKPNIGQNLWVLAENAYGLWVIADLWVMGRNFPQTNLVDKFFYGVCGVMGFERYGLRGVRLYILSFHYSWTVATYRTSLAICRVLVSV